MEPVYEQYPVKLEEGKKFNDFVSRLPIMGYVASRTKVVKVIEKIGKEVTEVDPSEFEAKVRAAFVKPVDESKKDYKAEFEAEKRRNDELERRLAALENKEPNEKEIRSVLFARLKENGLNPAKNATTDDLKLMVQNLVFEK